ncbi:cysteine hydrolase family protein [Kineococcus sp. LSe6-4]|uniref:Cysteine hydrolase family protein n=1 Tax=Kineococcus halophytocola TaxID=3234027 RepID=A0ABV4H0T7_9ACTN
MTDPRLVALAGLPGALLVVDLQRSFADPRLLTHLDADARERTAAAVARTAEAVEVARGAGVPVVWCRLRVRPDDPWPASNWFRGLGPQEDWPTPWEPCVEGTPGIEWYGAAPAGGELVVDKRTYDAFAGTSLAERTRHLSWVALAGLTSDCCVLATAGGAFSAGLRVVVLGDATTAEDAATHEAALRVLAAHTAVVADTARWRALVGEVPGSRGRSGPGRT